MSTVSKVIHTFLDILFPPACAGCKTKGIAVCTVCLAHAERLSRECFFCAVRTAEENLCDRCKKLSPFENIIWPWRYSNERARAIVSAFKYRKKRALAETLGVCMRREFERSSIPKNITAIPIPLHASKKQERGFNQAELLARVLGLPIETRSLIRIKATQPQARTHSRRDRQRQIKGAFALLRPEIVRGRNILLVDDVATTGATLCEAALLLKKAGAGKLYALVLAHG